MDAGQIDKAIAAHAMWKVKLRNAITEKKLPAPVGTIKVDNACEFGKWLYALDAMARASAQFKHVQQLHAAFHAEAGRVAAAVEAGKFSEADSLLEGDFTRASMEVTRSLMEWKRTL